MLIKIIEKFESSQNKYYHLLRGKIIKSKFSIPYIIYRFFKGIIMIFDYRMYALYSRKVFRHALRKEKNIFSLWLNSLISISDDNPTKIFEQKYIEPWMYTEAYVFIKSFLLLNPDSKIFEYGSGSSTLYFSKLCKKIISIESDKEWFMEMKNHIITKKIDNVELINQVPEKDISNEIIDKKYKTYFKNFNDMNFINYVNTIDNYKENFDIIIVDGYCRNACIEKSIAKIKKNGILVLDNSFRTRYKSSLILLENISRRIDFTGPTSYGGGYDTTSIFIFN